MKRITKATIKKIVKSIDTSKVKLILSGDLIEVWDVDLENEERERVTSEITKSLTNAIVTSDGCKDLIYWKNTGEWKTAIDSNTIDQFGTLNP